MRKAIAIVGGGVSGLLLAVNLGELTTVFEEHNEIGIPRHCTGLISQQTLSKLGSLGGVGNEIVEAAFDNIIIKPLIPKSNGSRNFITLKLTQPVIKINRVMLEKILALNAVNNGATINLGKRINSVSFNGLLRYKSQIEKYEHVFIAEGAIKSLSNNVALCKYDLERLIGIQYESRCLEPDHGIYVFTSNYFKDFFGWVIIYENNALVGLASRKHVMRKLSYFVKLLNKYHEFNILPSNKARTFFGGYVIRGKPCVLIKNKNVIVVGDAAIVTKAITGGGLYGIVNQVDAIIKSFDDNYSINMSKYIINFFPTLINLRTQYHLFKILMRIYGGYDNLIRYVINLGIQQINISNYDNYLLDIVKNLMS